MSASIDDRLAGHLRRLYPHLDRAEIAAIARRLLETFAIEDAAAEPQPPRFRSDEVVLITYGDTFTSTGRPHLRSLAAFWSEHLAETFSTVHVLPFFESSGDGGFSVVDYRAVAAELGDWSDFETLGDNVELMVDLVCNHGSAQSEWFADFVADRDPGRAYFVTASPDDDLSAVVRPRTHPLLTLVETAAGARHVWTTFSADQVDFDFTNPDVLLEFCSILEFYVANGAKRIRLDAIAYLWKQIGTTCIHLPQTHEVVKLMRTLLAARDPTLLLVTETNVPHRHNVSYFGDPGEPNEAHVVYNFTLAPLIVWSLISGRAEILTGWLGRLDWPPPGCTFLNFLASHDGIGLRPVEDLISPEDLAPLVEQVTAVGGSYSAYTAPVGPRPYELNVSLVDLLAGTDGSTADRFVVAHALMMAIRGIPAIYVHSMLASPGDTETMSVTGHKRDINRGRIDFDAAVERVQKGWRGEIFQALTHLIRLRRANPAFGPDSPQVVHVLHPQVVALERGALPNRVLALHNLGAQAVTLTVPDGFGRIDLISGETAPADLILEPWHAVWLAAEAPSTGPTS